MKQNNDDGDGRACDKSQWNFELCNSHGQKFIREQITSHKFDLVMQSCSHLAA